MAYQDGLKQAHSDLEPLAALRSPVTVLLGVSDSAGQALGSLGLKTVLDLATSPFFSIAASVASGASNGATQAFPLGEIPGGLLVDGGPTDLSSLARADLAVLRALTPTTASALKQALQVDTVGDLGRWPSYRAAKDILDVVSGSFSDETDGEVAELIPTLGQYPTERHFYSTVVLDQVAQQNTVDLATAGPIDLSPTLSLDFGFSVPAVGARLTFQQSWFAQGFALGNLLHSLALAPGESTRIAVLDWSRQTGTTTSESISETEQLSNATTHNRAVSEVQDSVAKEVQSGFSHTESTGTTEEGGAGFGLALGPVLIGGAGGIGHTTTSADSYSSSAGSRSLSASMNQKVMDATQQAASSSRNRRASIVQEVSQQEHEAVSTRIVANYNHMHALTVQYYEVVELYRVSVSLSEAERCLFVPMKVMEFTDPMVRRYQGVLAGAAIDRRARELLTTEFGSVHLTPTTSVPPIVTGIFTTMTGVRLAARAAIAVAPGTPDASAATTATTSATGEATSSTTTSPATGSGASSGDTAASRVFRWDVDELSRAARLTSSNVARVDAAGVYLAQNTTLAGLTVTTDRPGPVISAVSLKLHDGSAPIALTRTSVDWRVPQSEPLQEISEIIVTTEGQGTFAGTMTLELDYLGSRFPLTIPVGAVGNTTTSVCTIGAPEAGPELLQHLNANRLYYNQAIWRSLDASTTALLLSRYKFENQPVANLIDPKPLQVAGNYLVFRMPGFIARRDLVDRTGAATGGADDASLATWKKWLADKGLNFSDFTEQVVPVPTSGVFAEAVLGRSNSAEKLDATRFWNWQDSPIPLQPPEIAAINMDSRAQNIDVRPSQLGQPVLNIVNPTSLPDPTGLGAMIGALQNGGMFRDMSGLAATIGLAQATGADATSAAADATRLAAANMQVAAQHDIEARKVELAKQALAQQGASGGSPKTASEMGSLINSAAARDKQRAAEPASGNGAMFPGAGNGGLNGSGGGDYMPGVPDSVRGLLGSGSNGSSLQDSAFNRALWGGLGMPASDFVLADAKAAGSTAAPPPVVPHLDESHLEEWVHRALDGTHVIGSVAEIVEIFHASTAWPAIEASLSWGDAAAIGAAGAGEAGVAALIGEIAVPLGYVAAIVVTVLALHEAFTTGTRIQTKKGYCYGIMWEALKMPTPNRTFQPWGADTAEELKEAWDEGIDKGRSAFRTDVKLHNQVLLRIAYEQMTQNRYKFTRAEGRVLNLLWEQVRGSDSIGTHLGWMDGSAPGSEYDEKLDLMDGRGANQPPAQPPQPQPPAPPPPH